jgi:ribosomal protein S18 acetylase RimI-like enzyme
MLPVTAIISTTYTWQRYGVDQRRAETMVSELLAPSIEHPEENEFLVADVDGLPVGFVFVQHRGCFGMSGYIKLIGVAEQWRRSGIGRELLGAAERSVFHRGPNVFLLVSDFNAAARAFYEEMGYRRIGIVEDYLVKGIDEILYRKTTGPLRTLTLGSCPGAWNQRRNYHDP